MAFNEAMDLDRVVHEVRGTLDRLGVTAEILVIDDGSTDGTGALADRLAAEVAGVRVVHHEVNRGLGGVYRTGFGEARGALLSFFPADGQFPSAILESFVPAAGEVDLVLGYVERRDSPLGQALSLLERLLYRALFGSLPRFQGVFVVHTARLRELSLRSHGRGWAIVMEMLIRATREGWRMRSLPTPMRPRRAGTSKVQNVHTIVSNLRQMIALREVL